ncbi:MAG: transposase, partial [Cyanobacteria bacterium J06635_10]
MLLGFKTELKVNSSQKILLAQHAGVARHAWNWGLRLTKNILDHNQNIPEDKIKFPTSIDLHKWLVALVKPEYPWYYEVSKSAPQYALKHLRTAWEDCFKKSKKPPRFRKKGIFDSFTLDGSIKIERNRIKVPRIGWLKTYERLPLSINPKSVTVSQRAGRWFISFKLEIKPKEIKQENKTVAVDLGLLRFATLSTGEEIDSPRPYKKLEKKLRLLQWRNRHKVIGSSNWKKT